MNIAIKAEIEKQTAPMRRIIAELMEENGELISKNAKLNELIHDKYGPNPEKRYEVASRMYQLLEREYGEEPTPRELMILRYAYQLKFL